MKELNEEMWKQAERMGELEAQIKIWEEKFGKEEHDTYIEYLKNKIAECSNKIEILKKAEDILLGIC